VNQSILFNDDLSFDEQQQAWKFTGLMAGEQLTIFIHSYQLRQMTEIDQCTKFDLEEITELWLEKNEPESGEIHIKMN